ncbi:MAG: PSD1 and planctomycete cytochrome C domain-containing protein [Verrucomicrobiota bacterium]
MARWCFAVVSLAVVGTAPLVALDFAREVEPLLIKRCSECHGPDQQKGGLRLDTRLAAMKAGKSGKIALVPGDAAGSEMLARVTSLDPDDRMPPKGERLTTDEVALLRRWIEEGATWPEGAAWQHWAFRTPVRPTLPEPPEGFRVNNDIDRFIAVRLAKEGLSMRPEADRAALIRRVSLHLTGLPPTWAEVEAFERDTSPGAFERLVDRLLASPRYGEHMARGWLDLARYADSNGYQVDLARSIWAYRDWVIDSFNRNQRFDAFTVEQLAGDLLPSPTLAQRVATGFNRNTKVNDEGGGDEEEYRTKAVKDRVATLGTAWLGLTLNCAECHTHKYDPITQEEYYRLYAFFNNTSDGGNYSLAPTVEVPAPDLSDSEAYVRRRIESVRRELAATEATLARERKAWERRVRASGDVWRPLALRNPISTGGSGYTNLPDGSVLATGVNPIYDTITVEADTDLSGITAVLLEVLPDPSLPKNGPGRWGQTGNFILDEFAMSATPAGASAQGDTNVAFAGAMADWEQTYYRAEHAVDRNPKTGWAIGPRFGERHFLVARLKEPVGAKGGSRLAFRFDHYHGNNHCVGRFRISVTTSKDPSTWWPVPEDARAALAARERTDAQEKALASAQRAASESVRAAERELARLESRARQLASRTFTTPVMQERGGKPRETHVHVRGDFLTKGKPVEPGVPAVFPPLPAGVAANRLALARWLVDPAHPLTARVAVNRFWERAFGTGMVKTSEDFGRQGEAPSHPELLDWLATEFVRTGWDVKAMQKLIVMSAAYRQEAASDDIRQEKDFYNRWVSRGPRFRMDGEMLRDHALAVSGLLNPRVGGPSVHPVQVANLWKEIGFLRPEIGMDEWPLSDGPDLHRRGMYTFWRRVCTYPTFATFDAPSREVCVARRPRTNTPLQALAALNDPTLLEAARVFAQRILAEGGRDPSARVDFAFQNTLGRRPTPQEALRLRRYAVEQERSFARDVRGARELVSVGSTPVPSDTHPPELAAWMLVANVLFNTDEALNQ